MIFLVVTLCSAIGSQPCEERWLPLRSMVSIVQCEMALGQIQAQLADPEVLLMLGDQRVAAWRCEA